jgi:hypothetical protein
MFMKYAGAFGKAEAEWAKEVLDLNGGDQDRAEDMIADVMEAIRNKRLNLRLYELGVSPPPDLWGKLKALIFGQERPKPPAPYTELEACFVAAVVATHPRCWWLDGLAHLEEMRQKEIRLGEWKVPAVD